jgi:lipoprotein-anchoring transpeptidase ErfK/SrfK
MGKRRLYELAQEHGLTSGELMRRLELAGIEGKQPLSAVDEDVVEAALRGSESRPAPPEAAAAEVPPAGMDRLRARRRLRHLRRLHDSQLKELAGLAVELHRLDSPRYEELAAERLSRAAATDRELIELEREIAPDDVGGACPNCGLHSTTTRYCLRCGEKLPGRGRDSLSVPGAIVAIVVIAAAWLLGGANLGSDTSSNRVANTTTTQVAPARPQGAALGKYESLVATAKTAQIGIYRSPHAGQPFTTLASPNLDGAPQVFLVKKISGGWARVLLPIRPNGSSGWIKVSRVSLARHTYRLSINLDTHKLTAFNGAKVVLKTPVGVGRAVTPTPSGQYYITELLKQPDPTGTYGPYAFGLSAHSNVLHEFAGRDGILGLHGTNFPQGVGTNVSHGCIRVSNKAIVKLANTLPVGTPVKITRTGGGSA